MAAHDKDKEFTKLDRIITKLITTTSLYFLKVRKILNNLSLLLKRVEKEEQTKPKAQGNNKDYNKN